MLLLLPPSEGKTAPAKGDPVDLAALPHADVLGPLRARLIAAVDPGLADVPAAPAGSVYTGVLYGELGLATLPARARRRAAERVLIASGLWGLVGPGDRIPAYKLPIGESVDGVGGLAAAWRPLVAQALDTRDADDELIVDCRSGGYAAVWRPRRATRIEVRAFRVHPNGERQVISHMAKASRGAVARALLQTAKNPRTPRGIASIVTSAGIQAELGRPVRPGAPWTLDVLER